jgi:hypothetical protein
MIILFIKFPNFKKIKKKERRGCSFMYRREGGFALTR